MMRKRLFPLFLVCLLVLAVVGCANQTGTQTPAGTTPGAATPASAATTGSAEPAPADPYEKHLEITWLGYTMRDGYDPANQVETTIEEMFNVTIEPADFVNWGDNEQMGLMVASGELPDFTGVARLLFPQKMLEQELSRSIPISLVREYAPLTAQLFDEQGGWVHTQISGTEELTGIPRYYRQTNDYALMLVRYDWMEKLGIEAPGNVTDLGGGYYRCDGYFTPEAFMEMLDKFVHDDPDGNGKDDTIGMQEFQTNQGLSGAFGVPFRWGFGCFTSANVLQDGQAVPWWACDALKPFLIYMNEMYERGLIPQEVILTLGDTAAPETYFDKGLCGVYGSAPASCGPKQQGVDQTVLQNIDGSKIMMVNGLKGPDGYVSTEATIFTQSKSPFMERDSAIVGSQVDDEKLARILAIYDYTSLDDEGYVFKQYGVEGEHFTWEGVPLESGPVQMENYNSVLHGRNVLGGYYFHDFYAKAFTYNTLYDYCYDMMVDKWDNEKLVRPYKLDILQETDLVAVQTKYGSELTTVTQKYLADVMLGNTDLESTWDAYIAQLRTLGLDEWIEELNKAIVVTEFEKGNIVH